MNTSPLHYSKPRVIGLETEYAAPGLQAMNYDLVTQTLREDDSVHTTQFGAWGGRIYVELGALLEVATPESLSIRGLLASHFAGERTAAKVVAKAYPGYHLYKRTIDSKGTTSADHENYYLAGGGQKIEQVAGALASHLATRAVITGPGMLHERSGRRGQFQFMLDQRHLDSRREGDMASHAAQKPTDKPFALMRHEPFDNREQSTRLQIVSGSKNMFAFPIASRFFGVSALLRLHEYGVDLQHLRYDNPYEALHETGSAHGLSRRIQLTNGKRYTAPEMQLAIAEAVLDFHDRHPIPDDERTIAQTNRDIAEDLIKENYDRWADHVEWLAKRRLLEHDLARRGEKAYDMRSAQLDIDWHSLATNGIAARMRAKGLVALMPNDDDVDKASRLPIDPTRAQKRSTLLSDLVARDRRPASVTWHSVKVRNNEQPVSMDDAYDASPVNIG